MKRHEAKSGNLRGLAIFGLFCVFWVPLLTSATYAIQPAKSLTTGQIEAKSSPSTRLTGDGWSFTVPFAVKNKLDIEKLIQCESRGKNVSHPDNGAISDGILQFHRDPKTPNVIGSGTWAWMESLSGIHGSPIVPADAIKLTDWAISNGFGDEWSCWRIERLG